MWEKGTGFTTDLLSSGDLYILFQLWYIQLVMTYNPSYWCSLQTANLHHTVFFSPSFLHALGLSLSAGSVRQEQERRWLKTWGCCLSHLLKKGLYLPLLSFKFIFCFILPCLFEVCIDAPSPTSLKNLLLIIDKLQQYQYHICLYSCFKDDFVVYFLTLAFERFQFWMKKNKKNIWSCYTRFCFFVLIACTFRKWNINIQMFEKFYIYRSIWSASGA